MEEKRFNTDAETTGVYFWVNALIRFAAIVTINGKEVGRINLKIKPFPDDVIEETALEVNGLTREDLFADDCLEPIEAHKQIVAFLSTWVDKFNKKDKYFWHGYRAQFDSEFVREFFRKCNDTYFGSWFWVPVIDWLTIAGYHLRRDRHLLENFKLRTVYEFLYPSHNYSDEDWHDALFDIERTMDIEPGIRDYKLNSR